MRTREILPVRSNFPRVEEACRLFRTALPEREHKSKLPHPREVRLRMEIALHKGDIARQQWHEAREQKRIQARIVEIEAQLRDYNP